MLVYSFIVVNRNKNYHNLKNIDMSIWPTEKFINLTEDVALLTKIFMGKEANLVIFILFGKYFFNVFAADLNSRKNVFRSTSRHLFFMADYLELLAILYPLLAFKENIKDAHVNIMCDNTTAVPCINHMGTSHLDLCNTLTMVIWDWCAKCNIWLTAAQSPGIGNEYNESADYESRVAHTGKEWQLHKKLLW